MSKSGWESDIGERTQIIFTMKNKVTVSEQKNEN